MKKFIASLLCICMIVSTGAIVASAESVLIEEREVIEEFLTSNATVNSVTDTKDGYKVSILTESQEIILLITEHTAILNNQTGILVGTDTLKQGDKVVAYYSKAMSKNLPAQTKCVAIVTNVKDNETTARYMTANKIDRIENGIKVQSADGGYVISIKNDTPLTTADKGEKAYIDEIETGTRFFAWFDVMLFSYPAQAGADKVVVITSTDEVKPTSDNVTVYDKIILKGKEITIKDDPQVYPYNNLHMIPLRTIAEELGFEITWNNEDRSVTLDDGTVKTTLYIGKDSYYKESSKAIGLTMAIELRAAPVIINNTTYVPAQLFNLLYSNPDAVMVRDGVLSIR